MVETHLEHAYSRALYDYQEKHGLPKGFTEDVVCLLKEGQPRFRNSNRNFGWHTELQEKMESNEIWDERDIARAEKMWADVQQDLGLFN